MVERAEIRMKPREKEPREARRQKRKNRRRKKNEEANGIAGVVLAAGSSVGRAAGSAASGSGKPGGSGKCRSRRGRRSRPEETAEGKSSEVVVGEVVENRAEREKHFRMEDGSFLTVDYGVPVHYEAEEEWEEIDNTLIPQAPSVGLALEGAWRPVVQYRAENGEESRSFAGSLAGGYVFAAETGEVGVRLSLWEEAGEPEAAETEAEETMGTGGFHSAGFRRAGGNSSGDGAVGKAGGADREPGGRGGDFPARKPLWKPQRSQRRSRKQCRSSTRWERFPVRRSWRQ